MTRDMIFLLVSIKDFQCHCYLVAMGHSWPLSHYIMTISLPTSWVRFVLIQLLNYFLGWIELTKIWSIYFFFVPYNLFITMLSQPFVQSVPPTTWYRFVAGLNAQLRLVRRGCLKRKFRPVLQWLETVANPALRVYDVHVDLAWFQATGDSYCHYGLLIYAVQKVGCVSLTCAHGEPVSQQQPRYASFLILALIWKHVEFT